MRWGISDAERRQRHIAKRVHWLKTLRESRTWAPWFAWCPVETKDGWAWLETVDRKNVWLNAEALKWEYRYHKPAPDITEGYPY